MQTAGSTNRRRNYFIKKEFQAKFILKFCLLIILTCGLMGILIYFLSTKTVTTTFENLRLISKSTADFILPALTLSSLVAIIIVSLACVIIVLFISHRIAGPLYHFEKSIEEIAKGDLTVGTHLRRTDEIKMLADSLNEMTKKLRDAIAVSQDRLSALEKDLANIRERLSRLGISQDKINEILGPPEAKIKDIKSSLFYFKVK